jgi:hypothetical protein
MSIILPQLTRPPGFKEKWLVQIPGLVGNWVPFQSWPPVWCGYWHVYQGTQIPIRSNDPKLPIPARIQDEIHLKNRMRRQLRWIAYRGRWPTISTSVGTTIGASRRKTLIQRASRCERWLDGWWEYPLHHLLWSHQGACSLGLRESRSTCEQFEGAWRRLGGPQVRSGQPRPLGIWSLDRLARRENEWINKWSNNKQMTLVYWVPLEYCLSLDLSTLTLSARH